MKVFLDTNIIISAMLFPEGLASKAYYKCINKHECYISDQVIFELKNVFKRKFQDKISMLDVFIKMLIKGCNLVDDDIKPNISENRIRDVKDRIIYRTAVKIGCDAILTGDKDFIEAENINIKVISPREFE